MVQGRGFRERQEPGEANVRARNEYERALRRAAWRRIQSRLRHKCNELLSTESVLEELPITSIQDLGIRKVDVQRIVGSSGRYRDFDLNFLPIRREHDGRWTNVAMARQQGVELPPPVLYKIGDAYFVEDGNHRISVIRWRGEAQIEAKVIEIDLDGLSTEPACTRFGLKKVKQTEMGRDSSD